MSIMVGKPILKYEGDQIWVDVAENPAGQNWTTMHFFFTDVIGWHPTLGKPDRELIQQFVMDDLNKLRELFLTKFLSVDSDEFKNTVEYWTKIVKGETFTRPSTGDANLDVLRKRMEYDAIMKMVNEHNMGARFKDRVQNFFEGS